MCKKKMDTIAAVLHHRPSHHTTTTSTSFPTTDSGSHNRTTTSTTSSSSSTVSSLASFRDSLPSPPAIYPFPELRLATNNFLSNRRISSSSWRCTLRGRDAVVFQRSLRDPSASPSTLSARLSALCRSHHRSVVRLLGASLAGNHIYLAYEYAPGASLAACLRPPRNPSFTPLAAWLARIQVAADVAHALEYIHTQSATVHNRLTSSAVIISDHQPHFHAQICHFGAADLTGEINDRSRRIEGSRGYIAPEVLAGGAISQKSDVFAFGVVVLELLSGAEPARSWYDEASGAVKRESVVEAAREVVGDAAEEGEERGWRLRRWVDKRMRDSFPVEVAERLVRVAVRCVEAEPGRRPEMTWVAAKVTEILIESERWGERVRTPADISVSLAPR